jgi:hypothetical protein
MVCMCVLVYSCFNKNSFDKILVNNLMGVLHIEMFIVKLCKHMLRAFRYMQRRLVIN